MVVRYHHGSYLTQPHAPLAAQPHKPAAQSMLKSPQRIPLKTAYQTSLPLTLLRQTSPLMVHPMPILSQVKKAMTP